jgi:hypothetical protein
MTGLKEVKKLKQRVEEYKGLTDPYNRKKYPQRHLCVRMNLNQKTSSIICRNSNGRKSYLGEHIDKRHKDLEVVKKQLPSIRSTMSR